MPNIGDPAPQFSATDVIDGQTYNLSDFTEGYNNERKLIMKNRKTMFITTLLAFGLWAFARSAGRCPAA
jgi:hypothetical protein